MVKTPKTRHSKSKRPPVTIDLDPESVTRVSGETETSGVKPKDASDDAQPSRPEEPIVAASATDPAAEEPVKGEPGEETGTEARESEFDAAAAHPDPEDSGLNERMENEQRPADADGAAATAGAAPPPPARTAGNGVAFAAGIFGAVIALLVAGLLQWSGVLPSPNPSADDTRLANLQQQVASLQDNLDSVSDGSVDAAAAQKVATLQDTVNGLQSSLEKMQSGDSGSAKGLETLDSRMSALEKKVAAVANADDAQKAVDALDQRVSKLQDAMQSSSDAADKARASLSQSLKSLDERVSKLGDKVEANADQSSVMRLVAATSLKSVVDRGEPFASALDTFSKLTPNSPDLAPLKPLADKGIPTRAALSDQVNAVASSMVEAGRQDQPGAGYAERLWDSARSLVDVRPVGQVEGNDVPSIVARFEADVKSGDYEAALAEYDKLPAEAKNAGKQFVEKLRARQAADSILDKALTDALKAA